MNLRQSKGTPIREHMMKVIAYLNGAEILVAKIDGDTQILIVMNTLFDSFNQCRLDYELHPKQYTLISLVKVLQIIEGILKKKRITTEDNVAEADSLKAKPKGKAKKNRGAKAPMPKKKKKVQNPKGKCFHYGKDKHWKRNCDCCRMRI